MSLSIRKIGDIYIFYGGYKVKHIPKYHKFKWDPDNNYWYTYSSTIAQILLRCLLKPSNCTHLENYYVNLKLEQEAKLGNQLNWNWEDTLLKEFNKIELSNTRIKKVEPEQDSKVTIHKRKITLD